MICLCCFSLLSISSAHSQHISFVVFWWISFPLMAPFFFAHVYKCVITFSHSNFFLFFIRCMWTWNTDKALWWVRFCDKWHGNLPCSWGGWNKTGFDVCLGGDGLKTKTISFYLGEQLQTKQFSTTSFIYCSKISWDPVGDSRLSGSGHLFFLQKANVMNWKYTLTCFTNRVE